jgi:hypothetical protein
MPLIDAPLGELRLEKSIVIGAEQAKQMESRGEILRSDEYVDRDRGENLAPAQFVQETVDANTAARMAAARGISLVDSIDAAAGVNFGTGGGGNVPSGKSKLPAAILESFRKQPPMAPQMQSTAADFNPEFIASVQEANRRLNKAGGDVTQRVPPNAFKETLNEVRMPAPEAYANQLVQYPQYAQPVQQAPNVDYSVMAALMKDAVREVLKETNLKDIVKEVLKEERENLIKQNVNENIQIRIGGSTFAGKISSVQAPPK